MTLRHRYPLKHILRAWVVAGVVCMSTVMSGQETQVITNAELNIQKLFIEAGQEKLLGAFPEAADLYKEVLSQSPHNDAAEYELARVYEAMDENDKALEYINMAIRDSPEIEWYQVMKGDILEGMEEYAASVEVYEHLIQVNAKQEYYYEHLVELLKRINQPEKALKVLDQQEHVVGIVPELIYEKVNLLNEIGRPDQGLVELEKLLRLYPHDLRHLHRMAAQCVLVSDERRAMEYYGRILEIDPDDAKANLALASNYKASGDDFTYLRSIMPLMENSAIALDAKILELIPFVDKFADNPGVEFGPELGKMLRKLVELYPNEAKTHAILADYLFNSNAYREARQEYERTLALDKRVFSVWEQLMYLKLAQQDLDGVLITSEQALDVFPNQSSIYYLRGVAFAAKEDYNASSAALQQALIMSGKNTDLQFQILSLLGTVYQETGDLEKSYNAFDRALKLKPKDVILLNKYAYNLSLNQAYLERAHEMAEEALQLSPGNPDVEHTLAWVAYQRGDLKAARIYIEQCMDHGGGDHYKALEHYGDILFSMGETEMAIEHWQLSLDSGNPSEILKRKITERRIID